MGRITSAHGSVRSRICGERTDEACSQRSGSGPCHWSRRSEPANLEAHASPHIPATQWLSYALQAFPSAGCGRSLCCARGVQHWFTIPVCDGLHKFIQKLIVGLSTYSFMPQTNVQWVLQKFLCWGKRTKREMKVFATLRHQERTKNTNKPQKQMFIMCTAPF